MISPYAHRPASPAGGHSPTPARLRWLRPRLLASTRTARLRVMACALLLGAGWCADAIVDMNRTNAVRQSGVLIAQHLIARVASMAEQTHDAEDFQAFALHVGRRPEILHFSIAAGSPPVIRASSDPSLLGADPELTCPETHDLRDLSHAVDRHITRTAWDDTLLTMSLPLLLRQEDDSAVAATAGLMLHLDATEVAAPPSTLQTFNFLLIGGAVSLLILLGAPAIERLKVSDDDAAHDLATARRLDELERQRAIIDRHAIITVTDPQGRIIEVNDRFCEVSQYRRDELIGRDHRMINSGYHPRRYFEQMWRTIGSGETWTGEMCNRARDGSIFWADTTIVPVRSTFGRITRFVAIRTLTTTRKLAEAERAASEQRLHALLDALPDDIFLVSADGRVIESRTGSAANPSPITRDLMLLPSVLPVPAAETALTLVRETIVNGDMRTLSFQRDEGDAGVRDFMARIVPATEGEALIIAEDVTERRRNERDLRERNRQLAVARAEAEAANNAKSEFLANMSHEIRTPMTAVLGYTDLLLDDDADGLAAGTRRDYLSTIQRNGRHLMLIINDILDLSKIESGGMTLEAVDCDIREICTRAVDLMRSQAISRGLGLHLQIRGELPPRVLADPTRVRQILLNLIGNAVKFTHSGGVTVEVEVAGDPAARRLSIGVRDTGIGIPLQMQTAIFRPFAQADSSTTRRFGGTGLGLAICQRLAELMEGRLAVESRPGEGSTFTLTIPITEAPIVEDAEPSPETRSAPARASAPLAARILLAEDGPDNQVLIAHLLRRAGADVEIAGDGAVALQRVTAEADAGTPFDLLVMDIQMPVMDGISSIRAIRARGVRTPALALTAHAMADERTRCLDAGFNDFASKPIDQSHLLAACRRLVDPSRATAHHA